MTSTTIVTEKLSLANGNGNFRQWHDEIICHSFVKKCGDLLLSNPRQSTLDEDNYGMLNSMAKG